LVVEIGATNVGSRVKEKKRAATAILGRRRSAVSRAAKSTR